MTNQQPRTLEDLKANAVYFWPDELREQVASVSILPLLLKSQDKFLSVLNLSDRSPDAWKRFVDQSEDMSANMFLKHLMVLSDMGRETLSKLVPVKRFFKEDRMQYIWREQTHFYSFQRLHNAVSFTNKVLGIEPQELAKGATLTPQMEDLIMLRRNVKRIRANSANLCQDDAGAGASRLAGSLRSRSRHYA